jgi:hypothetical protein
MRGGLRQRLERLEKCRAVPACATIWAVLEGTASLDELPPEIIEVLERYKNGVPDTVALRIQAALQRSILTPQNQRTSPLLES